MLVSLLFCPEEDVVVAVVLVLPVVPPTVAAPPTGGNGTDGRLDVAVGLAAYVP